MTEIAQMWKITHINITLTLYLHRPLCRQEQSHLVYSSETPTFYLNGYEKKGDVTGYLFIIIILSQSSNPVIIGKSATNYFEHNDL
jgi:hypothetical protein